FDSATDTGTYGSAVTTGATPSSQDGDLVFGLFELQAAAATFTPEAGLNPLSQVVGGAVGEILQPVWKVAGAAGPQSARGTTSARRSRSASPRRTASARRPRPRSPPGRLRRCLPGRCLRSSRRSPRSP